MRAGNVLKLGPYTYYIEEIKGNFARISFDAAGIRKELWLKIKQGAA